HTYPSTPCGAGCSSIPSRSSSPPCWRRTSAFMVVLPLTVPPGLLDDQGLSSLGRARQQPRLARFGVQRMQENFRQFLDRLRQTGELVDLHQPVDIRHIATLVDPAKTALCFHHLLS